MILKTIKQTISIVFIIFSSVVNAEKGTPIEQLKLFLKTTVSLSADFKQVTINERGRPTQTSYGEFYLSRPGMFRWNYQKPYAQEIVSNEGKVWFYDVDLEQVTIKKLDDSVGATPALLLSGDTPLEDNYTLKQQGIDEGLQWIKLLPKTEGSGFNYILIGLDDGSLGGMELSDNFGQLTRIYFHKLKKNPKLDRALFKFKVPEGVDVFEN